MAGLCPGYKHVETFGEDEEYEEETEVTYVTIDLGTDVDKALLPNTSEYRLIGLDTPTPMLQLSGRLFKGTHEQLIGTEILFTDGRDDANFSRKFVVPVGTTEKRIQFHPVDVTTKGPEIEEEARGDRAGNISHTSRTKGKGRGSVRGKGKGRSKAQVVPLVHEHGATVSALQQGEGT